MPGTSVHGAGLGLRRELLPALRSGVPKAIDFFELAPENWMGMGGNGARTCVAWLNNGRWLPTVCPCHWVVRRRWMKSS